MAKVSSNKMNSQFDGMSLGMTDEEAKVAKYGDQG